MNCVSSKIVLRDNFSDKLIAIRFDEKDHGSTDTYTDGETSGSFIDTWVD